MKADPMTHHMLARRFGAETRYLNHYYEWTLMPHSFGWNFDRVLKLAMGFKDKPQQIGGVMADGTVEFTDIRGLTNADAGCKM